MCENVCVCVCIGCGERTVLEAEHHVADVVPRLVFAQRVLRRDLDHLPAPMPIEGSVLKLALLQVNAQIKEINRLSLAYPFWTNSNTADDWKNKQFKFSDNQ